MRDWTWPLVVAFIALLATVVALFALSNDPETQKHFMGYMDKIVVFVVGAAAGASTGYYRGFRVGKGI